MFLNICIEYGMFWQESGYTLVTKHGCPWSNKARVLLKKKKIPFVEIKAYQNNMSKGTWGYIKLKKSFKTDTFPIVYDQQGKRLGGYESLVIKLRSR